MMPFVEKPVTLRCDIVYYNTRCLVELKVCSLVVDGSFYSMMAARRREVSNYTWLNGHASAVLATHLKFKRLFIVVKLYTMIGKVKST